MTLRPQIAYSVDIALTVTLRPLMFMYVPPLQLKNTISELESILFDNCCKYVVIPELTPKNGNVHYHCILKVLLTNEVKKKGPIYVVRNMFRKTKLFGYIDVKQCDDVEGWIKYMIKELPQTIVMLDLLPDVIDIKKEEINIYLGRVENLAR